MVTPLGRTGVSTAPHVVCRADGKGGGRVQDGNVERSGVFL